MKEVKQVTCGYLCKKCEIMRGCKKYFILQVAQNNSINNLKQRQYKLTSEKQIYLFFRDNAVLSDVT